MGASADRTERPRASPIRSAHLGHAGDQNVPGSVASGKVVFSDRRQHLFRTIEAVIDERGNVRLLESIRPGGVRRALVTILDERPAASAADTARLSEVALAGDWDHPEEDEAWAHLQIGQ